jgi:phenylacetate-CoA ligase
MPLPIDPRELRAPQVREADLLSRLPRLIAMAQSSAGWARLLQGVDAPSVTTRAALAAVPVTRKSDLLALQRAAPPFGELLAGNPRQLRRIFMSPGPIFDPEGAGTDWWRFAPALRALGLQRGDLLQNCFSYHFTPAAFMVEGAAAQLGCVVIPAGVGQTEMQVQAMAALKPLAYVGTPSFLKLIIEKAQEMRADIGSVQRALVSAEALPPSLRSWLHEHGVGLVLQLYASADIGNIAFETATEGVVNPGMVVDEELLLEIVRPGTGDPVAPGEVGEVVVTSFNRDYPLVRFATGDLSALLSGPSPCGRTNQRIKGWMGRADQTTKVRAMFVHPAQVAEIVRRFPAIVKARLVVSGQIGDDRMTLQYETAAPAAVAPVALAEAIRDVTKLRGEVALVAPGSLPNDGKVIDDIRRYD